MAIAVSGAAGIDQALNQAARAGSGPRFAQIQRALHTAHLTRQNPWEALSDLGRRIGVSEYEQLAATIGLAGTEGARVRASLTARAQTLRAGRLAAVAATARAATERMGMPVVGMAITFLLLLGYPALMTIQQGLQ
ncbi:type II secretion system F family protein [Stackebrandtia endophytica]|uniref:type II secretion system F family protein n=1 Tax=Stackebrandtia endophytica TaxID=1496996 RepID=UPI0014768546|nr:type II secretion system F family protein [Stackebrandtia endophytica]